jgi:hypothetical protein
MPTSATLANNPVTLGSSVIQTSTLLLASGEYDVVPWKRAQKDIDRLGRDRYFPDVPGSKVEDPNVVFYRRKDSTQPDKATWMVVTTFYKRMLVPSKTVADLDTITTFARAVDRTQGYHFIDAASAAGTTSTLTNPTNITASRLRDPYAGGGVLAVTDEYMMLHETMNFIVTPVAASVPTFAPFEAAMGGQVPR